MRLTHFAAWHTFAGGTAAPPDSNSYQAITSIGNYHIDPTAWLSSGRGIRYSVRFANVLGAVNNYGGLWRDLSPRTAVTLREARRICQEHLALHNGTVNVPGAK